MVEDLLRDASYDELQERIGIMPTLPKVVRQRSDSPEKRTVTLELASGTTRELTERPRRKVRSQHESAANRRNSGSSDSGDLCACDVVVCR